MGTPATSVLPAYIFILHFEPRLMTVLSGIPTPKEQLAVCSGNQLKAHSGSMLAQSKFGVLESFLFASAEYALVVLSLLKMPSALAFLKLQLFAVSVFRPCSTLY